MKFKIDKNLEVIAQAKGESPDIVARDLCQFMMNKGWFYDSEIFYGLPVLECFYPRHIYEIRLMLAKYLQVSTVPSLVYDAFTRLVVLGEGDCPDCGGELKYIKSEGHEIKDGDLVTPNSYVVDWYYYECPVCGRVVKSNIEL